MSTARRPSRALSIDVFGPLLGPERVAAAADLAVRMHKRLAGRIFWNIDTTAVGGGVAAKAPGLDSRAPS